ncbi:rhomboid family intramembrane serine protease [Methylocella silvestris]|uniref:rhomboid family intramembrane serine protease n=1 Tax=Methylocella silvestris TaxID=199596 RepID=UPI00244DC16E|nr:rhomboid family intramembrane serine protease [Methylocella silvestris]
MFAERPAGAYRLPALPLREIVSNRNAITFVVLWFLANFLFGVFPATIGLTDVSVAWEAHVGGFLAGLLAFKWFDPPPALAGQGAGPAEGSAPV